MTTPVPSELAPSVTTRLTQVLLAFSTLVWAVQFTLHGASLARALHDQRVLFPEAWVVLGTALWALAIVSSLRFAGRPSGLLALAAAIVSGLTATLTLWLHVFRLPQWIGLLAALHFVVPILTLSVVPATASRALEALGIPRALDSRFGSLAARFSMAGAAILLSTAATEWGFGRLTGLSPAAQQDQYGSRSDLVLAPYLMFAEPGAAEGGLANHQGFIGAELSDPKPPGELRIALLGGSVLWQGADRDSIAWHLERMLREGNRRSVRVANFGRQSYVSMQELVLLEREVLPLKFDVVVVFDGFNDMFIPYWAEPLGVGYPYLFSSLKSLTQMTVARAAAHRFSQAVTTHSALAAYLARTTASRGVAARRAAYQPALVVAEYERNLYQMGLLIRGYGARALFATQPFVGTKPMRAEAEDGFLRAADLQALGYVYSLLREAAARAAERSSAEYADTTDLFDVFASQVFEDPVHIHSHGGNPIVARRLAIELSARGLLKQGSSP